MKALRKICLFLFVSLLLFTTVACERKGDIVGIEIPDGTFRTVYFVDEEKNFESFDIVVVYEKGRETVSLNADAAQGFDTSTTGEKTLTVKYGELSCDFNYRVVYEKNEAKDINTAARVKLAQSPAAYGLSREFEIENIDFEPLKAISFSLTGKENFIDELSDVEAIVGAGWNYYSRKVSAKCVKILIYREQGEETELGTVIINLKESALTNMFILADVTASDGETDYNLPDSAEV